MDGRRKMNETSTHLKVPIEPEERSACLAPTVSSRTLPECCE
jgi:hypothetical protein